VRQNPSRRTAPHKLTPRQQNVLSCLGAAKEPLGAYAILDRIRAEGAAYPSTIYRALNELMELGLVHKIESCDAFIACAHEVDHRQAAFAICRQCQKVIEVPLRHDQQANIDALAPKDIAVERVVLEFAGLCTACRAAPATPRT
jgi:Fur family zinc uptake transcriptional regulator